MRKVGICQKFCEVYQPIANNSDAIEGTTTADSIYGPAEEHENYHYIQSIQAVFERKFIDL